MRLLITCPFGLSAILGTELKRLGMEPIDSFGTGTYIEGNQKDMMQINIWSRIANKVYLEAGRAVCLNFDQLFALVQSTDWSQYVSEGQGVVVSVVSKNSALNSERTIQSITNKAIYQQLNPAGGRKLDKDIDALEVSVMIMDDFATIWINSSGRGLYQRGYRTSTGDAPLKENLAAAIVLLSNWKFSNPLWDPCCGSGTLVIEAAMIARNIAPGLQRRFAFETWKGHDAQAFLDLQKLAISKQFNDKKYQISASDLDPQMITIAQENAQKAGVADTISFFTHDLLSPLTPFDLHNVTIVSNPPYGKRLTAADLDRIYSHLVSLISHGRGGFITSYKAVSSLVSRDWMSKRMFNGADECALWIKR